MNFDIKTKEGYNNYIAMLLLLRRRKFLPFIQKKKEPYAPEGYTFYSGIYIEIYDEETEETIYKYVDVYKKAYSGKKSYYYFTTYFDPQYTDDKYNKYVDTSVIYNNNTDIAYEIEYIYAISKLSSELISYHDSEAQSIIEYILEEAFDKVYSKYLPEEWYAGIYYYLDRAYYTNEAGTPINMYTDYNDSYFTDYLSHWLDIQRTRKLTESNVERYRKDLETIFGTESFVLLGKNESEVYKTASSIYYMF